MLLFPACLPDMATLVAAGGGHLGKPRRARAGTLLVESGAGK